MSKSKIITYVAVAVLVLAGLYWLYGMINKDPDEAPVGVVPVSGLGVGVAGQNSQTSQFVTILNEIDNIDLKNHLILSNKIFTSLKDFGKTISDRAVGRTNPFTPFTGGAEAGTIKKETPIVNPNPDPDLDQIDQAEMDEGSDPEIIITE
jgi:hypothetical protein